MARRISKRKVLFFARDPHNIVVYYRVLRRLLDDDRIELHLTSKNNHTKPPNDIFAAFELPGARLVNHRLAAWRAYDFYLSPDIYLLCPRARIKVHTFHGISIKGKSYTEKVKEYDKLFLIGPYQRTRFTDAGILEADDSRFVDVGMPKTDALFDGSLDRASYLEALGLDSERQTVLYAPTWRPESSLYSIGEELIDSMRDGELNLLVKLHDLVYKTPEPIDWRRKLKEMTGPSIAVVNDLDVTPALNAADVLVSDASSVANEFTLLDRPIVFAEVPELYAKYADTIDRDGWGQSAGAVGRDAGEIIRLIGEALAKTERHRAERARIAREGFYHPGGATDAACEAISNLLELD